MFTKVDALMWSDNKFKSLNDDTKLLFVYILTCSHRNILGLYHLPIPYGSYDMNWDSKRFTKGLHELVEKGLINYNFNNNIVLIPNYLKYNPLENQNQVKGAIKALDTIPVNGLDTEIIKTLEGLDKPFIKPLIELLKERLGKHVYVDVDVYVDGEEEKPEEPPPTKNNYKSVYEHYMTLDLKKHRGYSEDMTQAIKKAMERNKYTEDYCKTLLDRHKTITEMTKSNEYPVKVRSLVEFFGQKVKNASHLICSEYEEGGKLFETYLNSEGQQPKKYTIGSDRLL